MTRKLLLALTLSLASISLAAAPASACGGARRSSSDAERVQRTVLDYAIQHVSAYSRNDVVDVRVEGGHATAVLRIEPGTDHGYAHEVVLQFTYAGWRVTEIGPRRALRGPA